MSCKKYSFRLIDFHTSDEFLSSIEEDDSDTEVMVNYSKSRSSKEKKKKEFLIQIFGVNLKLMM